MNIDSTQVYIMMYKWSINAHILFHLLNRQIRTVFWEVSKRWITRSSALSYTRTCLDVARTILQYNCKTSQPCHHIYRGSPGGGGGGINAGWSILNVFGLINVHMGHINIEWCPHIGDDNRVAQHTTDSITLYRWYCVQRIFQQIDPSW